jgi:CubicO group peptidase (beta-lactamase class C family)
MAGSLACLFNMRSSLPRLILVLLSVVTVRAAPAFEWKTATPEQRGFSSAKLDALRDHLAAHKTSAFLLIHDDRIIYEWYSANQSATKTHSGASMAKALVGGVCTAVAMSDGRLTLDDPASKFIPQWRADPVKSKITIRQLGSHTSGIDDAEDNGIAHDKLTGWKGDFWKRLPPPNDPFTISRDLAPLRFAPGEAKLYSNPGIAMLSYAITGALKATDAPEKDLRTLMRERIMRPIGAPDNEWSIGYGRTVDVDGLPIVASWGGISFTARTAARVARLMLREGDWDGRRLIKAGAVRAVTTDPASPPKPGSKWLSQQTGSAAIGWWRNLDGVVPNMPRDAYWAGGAGHQITLVIPSLKIIAVRNGQTLDSGSYDEARDKQFFQPLMAALKTPR